MEYDQITKRVEWLDDERRKEKTLIATLEDRLVSLEGEKTSLLKQVKDLNSEVSRLSIMQARFDQIEGTIAQMKVDYSRALDSIEKQRIDKDRETDKIRRADIEDITKSIAEVRGGLEPITELKKGIQLRVDEDFRLSRLIDEIKNEYQQFNRSDEEEKRAMRLLEENQRQDSKRIVDLQGEMAALRKRTDEQRGKLDLSSDNLRKLEVRVNEIQVSESERRLAQTTFIEKQNMLQVDRERVWKDWQARFADITKQAADLNTQLQALDAMNRTLKRSQSSFEEITQAFERRVKEITEMQRLVEERFRQEWVAFKADDQKRWTNYSLSQEEQHREFNRKIEKHNERIVLVEDITQEVRDLIHQAVDETRQRLQKFVSMSQDLLEDYESSMGNSV